MSLFDFSDDDKQSGGGQTPPGNSILAMKIEIDDEANKEGVTRNNANNKDMFACKLVGTSKPFDGATIFSYNTIDVDDMEKLEKNAGKSKEAAKLFKNAKTARRIGRASMRGLIDSAKGLNEDDDSPEAMKKRVLANLSVLHGKTVIVKTKLEWNAEKGRDFAGVAKFVTKGEDGYDEAKAGTSFVGDVEPKTGAAAPGGDDTWGGGDEAGGSKDWEGGGDDTATTDDDIVDHAGDSDSLVDDDDW